MSGFFPPNKIALFEMKCCSRSSRIHHKSNCIFNQTNFGDNKEMSNYCRMGPEGLRTGQTIVLHGMLIERQENIARHFHNFCHANHNETNVVVGQN